MKLKTIAKNLWDKTDGWKTIAGIILHAVWGATHYKLDIDSGFAWSGHGVIVNLTGVGAGHKIQKFVKSDLGKKILKSIIKK